MLKVVIIRTKDTRVLKTKDKAFFSHLGKRKEDGQQGTGHQAKILRLLQLGKGVEGGFVGE